MNQQNTPLPCHAVGTLRKARSWMALALGVLALGASGCYARARAGTAVVYQEPAVVYQEPVVEVATVPAQIEYYPRHHYRGSYVYLVDGRWYHRDRGRWVVYRSEPRDLASVRVSYEARYGRGYRPRGEVASPPPRRHRHHHQHHDRH